MLVPIEDRTVNMMLVTVSLGCDVVIYALDILERNETPEYYIIKGHDGRTMKLLPEMMNKPWGKVFITIDRSVLSIGGYCTHSELETTMVDIMQEIDTVYDGMKRDFEILTNAVKSPPKIEYK